MTGLLMANLLKKETGVPLKHFIEHILIKEILNEILINELTS